MTPAVPAEAIEGDAAAAVELDALGLEAGALDGAAGGVEDRDGGAATGAGAEHAVPGEVVVGAAEGGERVADVAAAARAAGDHAVEPLPAPLRARRILHEPIDRLFMRLAPLVHEPRRAPFMSRRRSLHERARTDFMKRWRPGRAGPCGRRAGRSE